MNLIERRSIQRKSWLGLIALAAVPVIGIVLLSASLSLFFVVLLTLLLCGAFLAGFALLSAKFRFRKHSAALEQPATLVK